MKFLTILASLFVAFPAVANDASAGAHVHKDVKEAVQSEVEAYEKYLKEVKEFESSDKFKPELLTKELPFDINLGNPDAPIKIVEYASLTCIHCKQFHTDIFYELKKNYIDTGKVYFKFRHYPLNSGAAKAALVTDCVAKDQQQAFIGSLFHSQAQWAYVKSEAELVDKLKTMAKIAGIDNDKFQQCYNNEDKQNLLLDQMKQAYDQVNVNSTPSIYVNGSKFVEGRSYEAFAKYLDSLIANGGKAPAADKGAEKKAPAQTSQTSEEPAAKAGDTASVAPNKQ